MMKKSEIYEFLINKVPLFKDFSAEHVRELLEGSSITAFAPNEAIIKFGEEGRFLGILLEGAAEACSIDGSGEKRRLAILNPGDIFGEMAMMTGDKTVADVIGLTRCTAVLVPRNLFSRLLVTAPSAIKYLSKTISDRLKSTARALVFPLNEDMTAARETKSAARGHNISSAIKNQNKTPIPIEVSAHHVHLSQGDVEALFGKGHQLTFESPLSQPGQFACTEKVNLIGPKGRIERVRVLGPARNETQIEIAITEQFKLGIHPPIRESGQVNGTPGVALEGLSGLINVEKGVICALRHIHMSPEDALAFGLGDRSVVRVRIEGDRELIFGDVLIRVHPDFRLAMHIDTDEANAGNISTGINGYIDAIQEKGV